VPQIIFLSLFLGLVSGPQMIELQVDAGIRSVRVEVDGRAIGVLEQTPWQEMMDLGDGLQPRRLVAIGLDEKGQEIARTTQILNIPRAIAEVELLPVGTQEAPTGIALKYTHRLHAKPTSVTVTVDGKKVSVDDALRAKLPKVDLTRTHVVAASVGFRDGFVARGEMVIGGGAGYYDAATSELTAVAVRKIGPEGEGSLNDCFLIGDRPVRTSAAEKRGAVAIFVKDPDDEAGPYFEMEDKSRNDWVALARARRKSALDADTTRRFLWPLVVSYSKPGEPTMRVFPPSSDIEPKAGGMHWLLTRTYGTGETAGPRRFADAVAAAGIAAMAEPGRRAVVLVLSDRLDASDYKPAAVRRYLESVGVPLFVWSLRGPRPELRETWGEVEDVSSAEKMEVASSKLRQSLAEQRIVWLAADPVTALRVTARPRCGVEPLAR
jgi:hypothetical protein